MSENFNVLIFSVDQIFVSILNRIFENIDKKFQVEVFQFFSEAQNFTENKPADLILVDDHIIGTSSYELISFLRLHKKFICPFFYFGTSIYEGERKALLIGANKFFNKPFKPDEIAQAVGNTLNKNKKK